MGVKVFFLGREFTISSEREQILDLLISTFEDAVRQNQELRQREEELKAAKEELARYAGSLEDRLSSVLNSVPDVLFSMSRDGTQVHYISPAAAQVFGYEPEEVLTDTDAWYRRLSPEDMASVRASQQQAVATRQSQTVEYPFRHRDESVRWIQTTFVPVSHGSGAVTRVDGISRDVTQQRRLEAQFRQAQKMEAVGRLAGGVAHDFNNLLTVIMSYSDLLLGDLESTDPRRADLEEIRKAAAGAAGLTRQLLAFSRQQVLEPRVLDLNSVVTGAGNMLQRLIGDDVGLVTVLTPDLGAVKADPGQLEQVIMNLAVNARDAMPEGGKITVETGNVELDATYTAEHTPVSPGAYVLLSVSDTGVGMDEETKRRLFEPFFTTKEKGKGTGLGLSTVYGIVKQSGGFIWVYSEPGHGTTFKIYLPRVDEQAQAERRGTPTPQSVHGTETVLLAEDADPLRAVARQILKRNGYTVLEAPDGKAALDKAAEHDGPIHLLITDVIMPEMSGRQLAERLRERRPELKVLFVSGYTDNAIIRHGVLEPGIAFLQKPFSPESLARKVREVLDLPQPR
jgi:PAS domain S-box-containing protein